MANDPQDWTSIFMEKLEEVIDRPESKWAREQLAHVLRQKMRQIDDLEREVKNLKNKP